MNEMKESNELIKEAIDDLLEKVLTSEKIIRN
jgi:hypothetical protein